MNRHDAEKATTRLLDVIDKLRNECPWDREQTYDSLRNNTIEETYELADAITDRNMEGIKEELGRVSKRRELKHLITCRKRKKNRFP